MGVRTYRFLTWLIRVLGRWREQEMWKLLREGRRLEPYSSMMTVDATRTFCCGCRHPYFLKLRWIEGEVPVAILEPQRPEGCRA